MEVLICNPGKLPVYLVTQAETEAGFVFRSAGVDVVWRGCEVRSSRRGADGTPWFLIRLRKDSVPHYAGKLSLHAMGRAFVAGDDGYMADVYWPPVRALAEDTQSSAGSIIGYTMAHELGHLLLGPGHRPRGLMAARWGDDEVRLLDQRSLGFDSIDRARIREKLRPAPQETSDDRTGPTAPFSLALP